jgi:hypothetical protein
MVSKGMPLCPFHNKAEVKWRDLPSIDTASICRIGHRLDTMSDNLVAMKVQIERPLCPTANRTAQHINVESFRRFKIQNRKGQMEGSHD